MPEDMPDELKPLRVTSSDISPDGALKAWGRADGLVEIRQNHGQMLVTSRLPHASSISAIRFSDEGLLVATGAGADIRIWAARSGQFIAGPLKADNGVVIGLRFTEDGKHLVGLSSSNIFTVWDTRSWQLRSSRIVPITPQPSQSR
jgi:WD40 repeat protein